MWTGQRAGKGTGNGTLKWQSEDIYGRMNVQECVNIQQPDLKTMTHTGLRSLSKSSYYIILVNTKEIVETL